MSIEVSDKMVEAAYKKGSFDIKETTYTVPTLKHKQRLKIMGLGQLIEQGALIGSEAWEQLEDALTSKFTINGMQISKMPDHFESNPSHYLPFMSYGVKLIAYPFS